MNGRKGMGTHEAGCDCGAAYYGIRWFYRFHATAHDRKPTDTELKYIAGFVAGFHTAINLQRSALFPPMDDGTGIALTPDWPNSV